MNKNTNFHHYERTFPKFLSKSWKLKKAFRVKIFHWWVEYICIKLSLRRNHDSLKFEQIFSKRSIHHLWRIYAYSMKMQILDFVKLLFVGFASLLLLKNETSSYTNSDAATHEDRLFAFIHKIFHCRWAYKDWLKACISSVVKQTYRRDILA